MKRFSQISLFYLDAFFLGICLIVIPAASFIFKGSEAGGLSDQQYGISFLPMNASAVVVCLFFRKALARWGRSRLLTVSFIFLGGYLTSILFAGRFAQGNCEVFLWVLGANLCLGIGFGFLLSVLNLVTAETDPPRQEALLLGLHAALGVGAAISPLLVHFFNHRGDWTQSICLLFVLWAGLLILGTMGGVLRGGEPALAVPNPGTAAGQSQRGLFPRGAWFFFGAIFIYGIAESIAGNWSAIYLTRVKAFSEATAASCLSVFWIMLTAGRLLSSVVSMRVDVRKLYRLSPILMAFSFFCLLRLSRESAAIATYGMIGFSCSYFFPLSIGLAVAYFENLKEAFSSVGVAALMAGVSVGSSLTGCLQAAGWLKVEQTMSLAAIASVVLVGFAWLISGPPLPRVLKGKS